MSRLGLRLFIVALLDVTAVLWGLRQLAINYYDARTKAGLHQASAPDPVLDPINIRYFAYKGMLIDDVDKVYPLPIERVGDDSAWVTVKKWPKGHAEFLMVRDGRGWKKAPATRQVWPSQHDR